MHCFSKAENCVYTKFVQLLNLGLIDIKSRRTVQIYRLGLNWGEESTSTFVLKNKNTNVFAIAEFFFKALSIICTINYSVIVVKIWKIEIVNSNTNTFFSFFFSYVWISGIELIYVDFLRMVIADCVLCFNLVSDCLFERGIVVLSMNWAE